MSEVNDAGRTPLMATERVSKLFEVGRWPARSRATLHAVEAVSVEVDVGKTLGIVGESGCGKSTLGRLMSGLLAPSSGAIRFNGRQLAKPAAVKQHLLGHVQMVFQDPASGLDPRMSIATSVAEPLRDKSRREKRDLVGEMLGQVGLAEDTATKRPHELSGGQQQRACIARALITRPKLIVLDEVVSAVDALIKGQIIALLQSLQDKLQLAYAFISHDLDAVAGIADTVAVMYLGEVVEIVPASVFSSGALLHPYSVALSAAKLSLRNQGKRQMPGLRGEVPSAIARPTGCSFHTRCPIARAECRTTSPPMLEQRRGHLVACHFAGEVSP